jgi:integrase
VLLLDKIVDRGAPVMANRVCALLAQMFGFGVERGMLDASPFISLPRPGGTEKSRNRKLDDRELRIFWRKLTSSSLSAEVRIALKLILVTAQRPGEVALAAREEFDLENRLWTIPPERSKNGKPHPVPLSDLALTLLYHLRRRFGETQYLIPSRCWRARNGAPITVRALSQGIRDREAHFGIPHFTPHDLRRTAASLMTAAGVPRLHVEKVLNHTIDDVAELRRSTTATTTPGKNGRRWIGCRRVWGGLSGGGQVRSSHCDPLSGCAPRDERAGFHAEVISSHPGATPGSALRVLHSEPRALAPPPNAASWTARSRVVDGTYCPHDYWHRLRWNRRQLSPRHTYQLR